MPTWRSKRATSLADATLDASLPSSKAPSAHRSMSLAGRMTHGGSRITPVTRARNLRSHTHTDPLPAHTSSKHPRVRSHAQHRPARRGGSDSQRERKELGVTPGPTTQQDTAKRGRKRGESKKKRGEERESEEREKEREEQQSRHQPTHTHTYWGRGGQKQKQKTREAATAAPDGNTNRSQNGKTCQQALSP